MLHITRCPVCNRDYKSEGKLVANENDSDFGAFQSKTRICDVVGAARAKIKFAHFTCDYCQSHFAAIIVAMPKGVSTIGVVTDLNFKDMKKLYKMSPIAVDEIIEGYKFINSADFYKTLSH